MQKGGQLRSGEPCSHEFLKIPPNAEYSSNALSASASQHSIANCFQNPYFAVLLLQSICISDIPFEILAARKKWANQVVQT